MQHTHASLDPSLLASRRGLRAVMISFAVLTGAPLVQLGVVLISGSVALLADTIHNLADAASDARSAAPRSPPTASMRA